MSVVLIPAFLLAQLFCLCTRGGVPEHSSRLHAETTHHECCDDDHDPSDRGAPGHDEHKHDHNCSHCTGEARGQAEAVNETAAFAASLHFLAPVLPALLGEHSNQADALGHAFALWNAEPSPPPDLLRVKCSLQI